MGQADGRERKSEKRQVVCELPWADASRGTAGKARTTHSPRPHFQALEVLVTRLLIIDRDNDAEAGLQPGRFYPDSPVFV